VAQRIVEKPKFDSFPLQSAFSLDYIIDANANGEEVAIPIDVIVGSTREPRLVAIAGVHGNEIDGIVALQDVWHRIDPTEFHGTLIVVPVAHPPSMEAGTRIGPEDGLDMNRVFPGDRHGSITQKLAYHLFHDVILGADLLATFHGWINSGIIIPYTEFPDGIGESTVEEASLEAGKAFGFEVLRVSPDRPGRLLPEAVRSEIPTIESEIGGLGVGVKANWEKYSEGLLNLLRFMKMLPGDVDGHNRQWIVRPCEVVAPTRGMLRNLVNLNTWVNESQLLAVVTDAHGRVLDDIRSPAKALVGGQRWWPFVEEGERVCTLFIEIEDYAGPAGAQPVERDTESAFKGMDRGVAR
jgi:predicted deacylase